MGLRLGEALALKVGDIDAARMLVHVRCAKGRRVLRDRFVTLPMRTLLTLRQYWGTHRHSDLLFPAGKTNDERHRAKAPRDRRGLQASFKAIVRSCSIRKHITFIRYAIAMGHIWSKRASTCAPSNISSGISHRPPRRCIPSSPKPLTKMSPVLSTDSLMSLHSPLRGMSDGGLNVSH